MDETQSSRKPALSTTWQRYFHTLRHLRPGQVVARLRLTLSPPTLVESLPTPSRRVPVRTHVEGRLRESSMVGANDFVLLNERGQIRSAADWNDGSKNKLWLYNLHYFDDLNAAGSADRHGWHTDVIERWVVDNPPTS